MITRPPGAILAGNWGKRIRSGLREANERLWRELSGSKGRLEFVYNGARDRYQLVEWVGSSPCHVCTLEERWDEVDEEWVLSNLPGSRAAPIDGRIFQAFKDPSVTWAKSKGRKVPDWAGRVTKIQEEERLGTKDDAELVAMLNALAGGK